MNFKITETNNDELLRRVNDLINSVNKQNIVKHSHFLDERQCDMVLQIFKTNNSKYLLFGGFENAKRKVLTIYPEFFSAENITFPIDIIKVTYREKDILTHRDFLGALMSFQIKREFVGDIIVLKGCAFIFIYNTFSSMIINEMKKVGKVGVNAVIFTGEVPNVEQEYEEINGSVASLRLDCVVSLITHLSREKSAFLIKNLSVEVNYVLAKNISFMLKKGDIFSIKGYGKFIFFEENGISKKGRYNINLKKFI